MNDMLPRHPAAQEIKHLWKFTSGFIGPEILGFERSLSLSPGHQSSFVRLVKFLLEILMRRGGVRIKFDRSTFLLWDIRLKQY